MKTEDLLFVGIKGSVVALRRDSGVQVWSTKVGGTFVNVILDNEKLLAASSGEIFCLDALSGRQLWHNPLRGYGLGLVTMAATGLPASSTPVLGEKMRQQQQQAAAAGAASAG